VNNDFFNQFSDKLKEIIEQRREQNPEKRDKLDALLQRIDSSKVEFEQQMASLQDEISRFTSKDDAVSLADSAMEEREAMARELLEATIQSYEEQNEQLARALSDH
jgi:hypothetical protein